MSGLRKILMRRHQLAMAVIALALCMKALLPAGFMIEPQATSLKVMVCADATGLSSAIEIAIPVAGHKDGTAPKAHEACPFSALTLASAPGPDPVLLALALAFIMLMGTLATPRLQLATARRMLPPPCGPPSPA